MLAEFDTDLIPCTDWVAQLADLGPGAPFPFKWLNNLEAAWLSLDKQSSVLDVCKSALPYVPKAIEEQVSVLEPWSLCLKFS